MSDNDKEFDASDFDDGQDQEGEDILSLLNGESDGGEEDDDEEMEELEPQDGDSPEVLRTKLAAKNRIIRHREKAIKRMQEELKQKQSGGMTAEDIANILQQRNQTEENQTTAPTLEQLKEQFDEDPSSIIDLMMQREQALEQKLANVLKQRDEFLLKKTLPNGGQPAQEVQDLAQRLKQLPQYAGFSDENLLVVAETLKPIKARLGRVPASTSSRPLPINASNADVENVSKSALEAMGYTDND